MRNEYTHFIRYAKNHYERRHTIDDLRIILGHYTGSLPYFIKVVDVVRIMVKIAEKYGIANGEGRLLTFLDDISPDRCWKVGYNPPVGKYEYYDAIIYACLSYIRNMQMEKADGTEIIPLDEPDYNILPREGFKYSDILCARSVWTPNS